jgi:hypothetical protein
VLSLASRRLGRDARRLGQAAVVARAAGFTRVFASLPPADAAAARPVLEREATALDGVGTVPVASRAELDAALDRAAEAAQALRENRVVVDLGPLAAATGETPEAAVEALARTLHAGLARWSGVALAVRPAAGPAGLLRLDETEWLLDALSKRGVGAWLDPVRVAAWAEAGKGPTLLDAADRLARRVAGISLHGPGPTGEGGGLPEEGAFDWGTLRGLLPARAQRVLDVGPAVPPDAVVETRRRLEEMLGF